MMTLIAQLCALCAVCAVIQMAVGEAPGQGALQMIGGLLMMHLVISGMRELAVQLMNQESLMQFFEVLVR